MHRVEKPFRAGPPTPRNEPPSAPCDPGTDHGVIVPDDPDWRERDTFGYEWCSRVFDCKTSAREALTAHAAFCAGWASHRNHVKNNSPEPVDLRCAMCKSDD